MCEGILYMLLAAFAGCGMLMIGVVLMGVIEWVAEVFGYTLFQEVEEFEDEN